MAQPDRSTEPATPSAFSRSIHLSASGHTETGLSLDRVNEIVASAEGCLWVDVDTSDPAQVELFKAIHGLHPLSIEDALNQNSRPKLEE